LIVDPIMMSLLAGVRIAAKWLQIDAAEAGARAEEVPELDAVCVRADGGRVVLVGSDLRPLVGEPGVGMSRLRADFAAGWRTDYVGGQAA
jgi:hypothetical protein